MEKKHTPPLKDKLLKEYTAKLQYIQTQMFNILHRNNVSSSDALKKKLPESEYSLWEKLRYEASVLKEMIEELKK